MSLRPQQPKKRLRRQKKPKQTTARKSSLGGFFIRGVITLLPPVITLVIFGLLYQMSDRYVTGPINKTIYWSLERNALGWNGLARLGIDPLDNDYLDESLLPVEIRELAGKRSINDEWVREMITQHREQSLGFFRDLEELAINHERLRDDVATVVHPVFGILISLLLVLWLGWIVGGFVGRRMVQRIDHAMHFIPVVKSVYPYSKQLVEFFFAENRLEFDRVVAAPYPSKGLWSIGFVTSNGLKTLRDDTQKDLVTIFIPSSPMPMTGYTLFVEAENVVPLPISVDEALRITMTGGVLVPPIEQVDDEDVETTFDIPTIKEPDQEPEEDQA